MILEILQQKFAFEIVSTSQEKGQETVVIKKDRYHDIFSFLKNDPQCAFEMLMDLCGVDYLPTGEKPRFEIVCQLYSLTHNHRLRVRVKISEEDMSLPTLMDLWKSADWFEREAFDMFGFQFVGHPHLKRLLMFEGFKGYPLRKDYPISQRQKIPEPEEILT